MIGAIGHLKNEMRSFGSGEAACRGRERVGALKIEEHSFSDLARRTGGGGGSECAMRREHRRPPICSSAFWCMRLLQLLAFLQSGEL